MLRAFGFCFILGFSIVSAGETSCYSDNEAIKKLFEMNFGQHAVTFQPNQTLQKASQPMKIGVILSGKEINWIVILFLFPILT